MGLTVKSIINHFIDRAPWVNPQKTCDKIVYGNPDKEVTKIGTGWSACYRNLAAAAADNCDLFITHESLSSSPWDDTYTKNTKWYKNRISILKKNNIAVIRLHDTWDHWPQYGIRDSWAQFLGIKKENLIKELDYIHPGNKKVTTGKSSIGIYSVSETTVRDFAKEMVSHIDKIGSNGLTVMGNPEAAVNLVALGVGCHIPTFESYYEGSDLLVMVYDRANQLSIRLPLVETGANLIIVEHGTAEIPAMNNMTNYLKKQFPEIKVSFHNEEPRIITYTN